jgi:hypothetical protein
MGLAAFAAFAFAALASFFADVGTFLAAATGLRAAFWPFAGDLAAICHGLV